MGWKEAGAGVTGGHMEGMGSGVVVGMGVGAGIPELVKAEMPFGVPLPLGAS